MLPFISVKILLFYPDTVPNELMREIFDELGPKYTMVFTEIASQANKKETHIALLTQKMLKKYVKNGLVKITFPCLSYYHYFDENRAAE